MEAVTIAPRGRTLVAMITCSRLLALAALLNLLHSFSCAATETEPAEDAHVLVPGSPSVVVETAVELKFDQEHALWTRVLQRFVRDDEFDYGGLQRDQDDVRPGRSALALATCSGTAEQRQGSPAAAIQHGLSSRAPRVAASNSLPAPPLRRSAPRSALRTRSSMPR